MLERNDQKGHFGCNVEDGLGKEELRTEAERPVRKLRQQSRWEIKPELRPWKWEWWGGIGFRDVKEAETTV